MSMRFFRDNDADLPQSFPRTEMSRRTHREAVPVAPVPSLPSERAEASTIFVPEHYEENYAYPLIVWIHGDTNPEHDLDRIMPLISERNYFGMSLEAPALGSELEEVLCRRFRDLRRDFHIHSERIFLAGFGEGGTRALELGLAHPEWFAGIACLSGKLPDTRHLLRRFRDLKGKRVLLAVANGSAQVTLAETLQAGNLLRSAGMKVCTRQHDSDSRIASSMLSDIDRWIMREIYAPQPVS